MSDVPAKDPETGRFLTGNIGGGRTKGSRNKLSEAFIEAMHESFLEHGPETIEAVRTEKPDQYLKVIASLIPKDVNLNIGSQADDLTDDELRDRIRALADQLAPLLGGTGVAEGGTGQADREAIASRVH